ncbi:DUF6326 family protein [Nocardioides jiangxiensis]|uniref:DUF6326 family protein n=1 Tax=Nocardioides jiangxiensis TaxID=3064524 RepID=A0ABT9B5M5_9ACTN|nr:DUF6326 family protein [Nocardioides sp. WY-20]MDO7869548.1 DUF6326 family protein [Nocardioides sp. WY-20]
MNTVTTLQDPPVPIRAKLATAWTSFMFLYIYVDYFALYKPGFVDDLRAGVVWHFDVSQPLLVAFLVLVSIPAVMIALSVALPARATRIVTLVVASLYVPVTAFNGLGEAWTWFYGLSIALELMLLAFILRAAWTWPRAVQIGDTTPEPVLLDTP